jgi:cell division protein FtsN
MKYITYFILAAILVSSSCAGTNKRLRKSNQTTEASVPIREVEEKLVPNENVLPDPHRYFVIIGSFRSPENAKKYQTQILAEGFKSDVLKNEAGLYRISVMATDDVSSARNEIKRIRERFPKYSDTWLLIQKI